MSCQAQGRVGYGIVNSAAFSPDGTRIVTGSDDKRRDGTARIWGVRNG